MASLRTRRRRRNRKMYSGLAALAGVAFGVWWLGPRDPKSGGLNPSLALTPDTPALAGVREIQREDGSSRQPVNEPAAGSTNDELKPAPIAPTAVETVKNDPPPASTLPQSVNNAPVVENPSATGTAVQSNDAISSRLSLVDAFEKAADDAARKPIRDELVRLGQELIFSPRVTPGDPLVSRHVIQTGDNLARIAAQYKLSADFLARVNQIADKNRIREGQSLKVVQGPFRAVVSKSAFTLDVYLDDVPVASYMVGVGAEDSTPTGEWRVGTKLMNPTYYPPRGGAIVPADDPQNPLGERWIALVGIAGAAVGQERYGIHGTNEPDSIGKDLSMGCIRMRNEDVEELYDYLIETHSTVTVNP